MSQSRNHGWPPADQIDMHVGVMWDDLEALRELLPGDAQVFAEGDDWEEWGERLWQDRPRHVVIRGEDATKMLTDLAYAMSEGARLMPMTYPQQAGILASITPAADWSEPLYELVDRRSQSFLRGLGDRPEGHWYDVRWLRHVGVLS